ncbi:Ig-like domain-containing protein [Stenotrophomonas sp. Iso1]|uniref:Ig-like domain-containing protein n=1 Tax=Stenotrophomonas sp. Iso1 TaxID=2977283 RepID=UPI0022B7A30D|nr:Ig-like domain-containing protein [Stenotrophomonas sp. Iso1]
MTVIVSVVADKSIASSKELDGAKAGKPVRIKAIKNGKYLLAENESGIAPENITVKRVGKNLHVALEGRDPDQPELIIEDFFSYEGQLVGLAEDGAYHEYIAVDGNGDSDVAFLLEGVSSPLALGSGELLGFGDGLVNAGAGILPWMLAGLGLAGAGVAIDRHNNDDKKPVVKNNGIGQVVDDQGPVQGNIEKGGVTDDDRPTLGGKGQVPGDTVTITDNGKVIGEVVVDKNGDWNFTPEKGLDDGEHSFEVIITDSNGNSSGPSDDFTVIVDTMPPSKPGANDAQLIDDAGAIVGPIVSGTTTDDNTPTYKGKAEPNATVVSYDNGQEIGRTQTNGTGDWTFTPTTPLVDGDHSLNYQVIDKAGNVGEKSDAIDFIVDTIAPIKPRGDEAELIDDAGAIVGPIVSGSTTDDNTPTYNGKGEPNATVVIYDNGQEIGRAKTNGAGEWTFTPSKPLVDGAHSLNYQVIDTAGNVGEKSDAIDFTVDTIAPTKPSTNDAQLIDDAGEVVGPIVSGSITDDNTPTYNGKSEPNATVVIYDNGQEIGRAQTNGAGEWTFTPTTPLVDGDHSLNYQVIDKAGNVGDKSDVIDFTVDTIAPTKPSTNDAQLIDDAGAVVGPILSGSITDDNTPTYKGKAEPNATVVIYDDGQEIGRAQTNGAGEWAFTPSKPLVDGAHNLNYQVIDKAGNVGEKSDAIDFIIDTIAPTKPTIDSVVDDQGTVTGELQNGDSTDDAQPTLSGSAEPGSTVVIYDNGKKIGQAAVDENGKWTFEPKLPLALGGHTLTVEAVDAAGNTSVPSDAFDLTLGNADKPNPPAITGVIDDVGSVMGNIQKNGITDDARPTIEGTAQPGMTVSIYIDGKLAGTVPADAQGNWSFTPSSDLADGLHNITATSTNSLGNVSPATGDYPIVVDTVAPSKPGSGDAQLWDDEGQITGEIVNGGPATDDSTPTFNGKGEPESTVVIYDNGKEIGRAPTDQNGDWSFTPTTPLVDGDHSLNYEVVDKAGNVSEKSDPIDFTVNTGDVEIKIESVTDNVGKVTGAISNGGVTDDATPTLHGKATAGGIVKIYEGSVLLGETTVNAEGKWSLELPNGLSEGAHALTATVTTATNGESTSTPPFNLTVDLSAPSKPSITEVGDDVGSIQGPIANGASTDDTTPTLKGQAEANSTVHIYDNGKLIGSVPAGGNGLWSFTPTTPLAGGEHDFTVTSEDKAGNVSVPSDIHGVVIDTVAPAKPVIETVYDDQGGQTGNLTSGDETDDAQPTISGSAEPNSTVVIYDNGKKIGQAAVDENGKWTFEPSLPLLDGEHDLTVVNVDSAGNESLPSDVFTIITDTVQPEKPEITSVTDNEGALQGQIVQGEITDDLTPAISGNAEPNSTVILWDNGVKIGQAPVDAAGNWTFVPSDALQLGLHSIHVTSVDGVGNASEPSDAFDFTINRELPTAPSITNVADDVGQFTGFVLNGRYTDDAKPTIHGKGVAGEKIEILVDGELIGSTYVGVDGRWKFTAETALEDGMRVLTAVSVSAAGIPSEMSNEFRINLDTKAPDAPTIETVMDDVGISQGELKDGEYTDDRRPTFNGKAEAGATVIVYDNGDEVGDARVDENGNWTWTPAVNLTYGEHEFTFEPFDTAGNVGNPEQWTLIIGNVTRGAPQAEDSGELLSIQDLLVDGDAELLGEGVNVHSMQMEPACLDMPVATGKWMQPLDSLNSTSNNGFVPVAAVMQDNLHQLENQLIG